MTRRVHTDDLLGESLSARGKEGYNISLFNIAEWSIANVGKVSIPRTAVVNFALLSRCKGVVVILISTAFGI
jgi:hypothetical protein